MYTGNREFDAYARSLRRTHWARQFEQAAKSISATTYEVNVGDVLAGEALHLTAVEAERAMEGPRAGR
jgi:hypothetical protein